MEVGLKDVPVSSLEQEKLKILPYVNSLATFVMQCDTPMTIAVQGDWGAGKTSMMKLVKATIEQTHSGQFDTIWFDTWQYSQFGMAEDLPASLLNRFITELAGGGAKTTAALAKNLLGVFVKNAAFLAVMASTGSAEGAKDAKQVIEEHFEPDAADKVVQLKSRLAELVDHRLAKLREQNPSDGRIIIFVDDLDRVMPARAVELLEVFKLFLDLEGCVFILACDYQVIAQGLRDKFGGTKGRIQDKSFFDKIIQLPFSMPVSQYDTAGYTADLLRRINIEASEEELGLYQNLIARSVGLNPRGMKRLFNTLQLLNFVAHERGVLNQTDTASRQERQRILFACLCMQTSYEPVYRYLVDVGGGLSPEILARIGYPEESDAKLDSVYEEMGGPESPEVRRLRGFMEAFVAGIQLGCDGDASVTSDEEWGTLLEVLNFSSITSAKTVVQADGRTKREMLKETLDEIRDTINERFRRELRRGGTEMERGTLGRANPYGEVVAADGGYLLNRKRLWMEFRFDARKGEPSYLWCESEDSQLASVFATRLKPLFENAMLDWDTGMWMEKLQYADVTPEALDDFKARCLAAAERLIPVLAQLREEERNGADEAA